jgi:hypothetical protein
LFDVIGPFSIDRFATSRNALLSLFNSYLYEENTSGVDAFAQNNWHLHTNFCNPPLAILGRFANFLIYEVGPVPVAAIVPFWPGAPWFSQLCFYMDAVFYLPE